jgi:hypothetical protein
MYRTLAITSPPMRGADVTYAQKMLNEFGVWVGAVDGVFGEFTGRACSEAKFRLGYSMSNVKPTYGTQLDRFLNGTKKPTLLMRRRAKSRTSGKSLGEKALKVGRAFVGTKESPPNSNRVMFSEWYGIIGPWCMMFVTYCFVEAGSKAFKKGERWSYCPFAVDDARAQKGTSIVGRGQQKSGDIVFFSWKHDGVANHVGILISVNKNGTILTLEGNTSVGNDSNGGEVQVRTRDAASVLCYVRAVV